MKTNALNISKVWGLQGTIEVYKPGHADADALPLTGIPNTPKNNFSMTLAPQDKVKTLTTR